jgi:hypothetical protein
MGQLFCRECGAKLDFSQMKPGGGSARRGDRPGITGRVIRLILLLVLLAALGLLCWAKTPRGDAASTPNARIVSAKMSALRGAIMRKNEVTETFSEADINAHLDGLFANQPKPSGLKLHLQEIRLDLNADKTQVWMKSLLGPLRITYTADVLIRREPDGRHVFTAGPVAIGRLPAVWLLRDRTVRQMAGVFSRLQEEIALLNRLPVVHVADGVIEVSTARPAP